MPSSHPKLTIAKNKGAGTEFLTLAESQRDRHCYIVGQTGTGKSTLLKSIIAADIEAGRGVGFLDPHGSEAEAILDLVPAQRIRDAIYYNPQDTERPVSFNVLANVPTERGHLMADAIVASFKHVWSDSWGPRLEYILQNALQTLIEAGGCSIVDIRPLLTSGEFRERILSRVKSAALLEFWRHEFDRYPARFREEAISPILNKLGQISLSPPLRASLGGTARKFDMGRIMDSRQIFIANLSKSGLGASKSALLGSLLVSAFFEAAMRRPSRDRAEAEGKTPPPPFTLVIDEAQALATDELANILSEARKFGLRLVLANQFTSQLRPAIRDAIFGNVGSVIAFRVGAEDATILSRQFAGEIPPKRFTDLPNHTVITKLADPDGQSAIRVGSTLSPATTRHGYGKSIVGLCRQRFGRSNGRRGCG